MYIKQYFVLPILVLLHLDFITGSRPGSASTAGQPGTGQNRPRNSGGRGAFGSLINAWYRECICNKKNAGQCKDKLLLRIDLSICGRYKNVPIPDHGSGSRCGPSVLGSVQPSHGGGDGRFGTGGNGGVISNIGGGDGGYGTGSLGIIPSQQPPAGNINSLIIAWYADCICNANNLCKSLFPLKPDFTLCNQLRYQTHMSYQEALAGVQPFL